jgi:hypothetical protein
MGVIKMGVLSPVSGKVGPVIGSKWKNVQYLRGLATSYKDANTEKQKSQRTLFKSVISFLQPIKGYLKVAYKSIETNMTAYNTASKRILNSCVATDDDGAHIDYSKVLVSTGNQPMLNEVTVTCSSGKLKFTWSDESEYFEEEISPEDHVMPLAYNITKQQATYLTKKFTRKEQIGEVKLPNSWTGDRIVVYVGTRDQESGVASNSVYLGEFVVE